MKPSFVIINVYLLIVIIKAAEIVENSERYNFQAKNKPFFIVKNYFKICANCGSFLVSTVYVEVFIVEKEKSVENF